ncbi:MAG: cytidine deaminase [Bacillota bacterium]
MTDERLIEAARRAREQAYVPYSGFPVGAALLTEDGTLITGCNVENASYGLTNCAERTAIFKAVSEGHRRFAAIAVIADTPEACSPCGACRQVMSEFGPDARVILTNLRGNTVVTTVREILPGAFTPLDLPRKEG